MICNIIASFLVAMTLIHLKIKYDTEPIRYNPTNRKQLDDYKSLFVTNVLSIFLLIILIVYQTVVDSGLSEITNMVNKLIGEVKTNNTVVNAYKYLPNLYVGSFLIVIYNFISLIKVDAIIKYILCLLILCISVYIIVLSNSLSRASNNKIIPKTGGNTEPKPIEPNSWRGYDIQRYFTSQYIINSKLT
jgi:hypothetical protein